jgi:hypothetical protein
MERKTNMKVVRIAILAVFLILFSQNVTAQTVTDKHPVTDAEKIADALSAGPEFITKNATILDWPATPGGEYRVLRKGTNEWSCLAAVPGYPHDEPGCFDKVFMEFMKDGLAGRTPHINAVGISYMYKGAFVHKPGETDSSKPEFHVGPHIMIVSPHLDELQGYSRDGTMGMPYVTHLPNRPELFLVIPIRQWNEKALTN